MLMRDAIGPCLLRDSRQRTDDGTRARTLMETDCSPGWRDTHRRILAGRCARRSATPRCRRGNRSGRGRRPAPCRCRQQATRQDSDWNLSTCALPSSAKKDPHARLILPSFGDGRGNPSGKGRSYARAIPAAAGHRGRSGADVRVAAAAGRQPRRTARRQLSREQEPKLRWPRLIRWGVAAAALVLLLAIVPVGLRKPASSVARGDLNHDGQVDILDAFALAREIRAGAHPGPGRRPGLGAGHPGRP